MAFTKGHKLAKGRVTGSHNKVTTQAKEAIQMAFEGIGGVPALIAWAKDEKNQGAFYSLFSKLLPVQMSGTLEITTPAIVELPPKKPRE